jgi:hypothetical protein
VFIVRTVYLYIPIGLRTKNVRISDSETMPLTCLYLSTTTNRWTWKTWKKYNIKHIQWNLCNPTPEFSDILWHPTKIYGPKAFLFTKIKAEYYDTLYNPTHFPVPLVCWFRQVQLYIRNLLTSPLGRAKVVQCNFKHYFSYIMARWSESEYYKPVAGQWSSLITQCGIEWQFLGGQKV